MRIEPEIDGIDIVLVGDFNPTVFTLAWFALHEFLPKPAADGAKVDTIHPQLTAFSFDWLRLPVGTDHFIAGSVQAPYIRVRDFIGRVFTERPGQSSLRALGINRGVHFRVRDRADMDRIGRTLAPVKPWGSWGRGLEPDGGHGGMASLTMSQVKIEGRPSDDRINVKVEPSNPIIGQGRAGIYVHVNDHYTTSDTGPGAGERLLTIVKSGFDGSLAQSDEIVDHVMSLAE